MPKFISLAIHVAVVLLLYFAPISIRQNQPEVTARLERPLVFHPVPVPRDDKSGGGDRSELPVQKGRPPKFSPHPFVPPLSAPPLHAKLQVEPEILGPEHLVLPAVNLTQVGYPEGVERGGFGRGINGIGGPGKGGYGEDEGGEGGVGGRVTHAELGSVTDPVVISKKEPEFSEEARKAKLQGAVLLEAQIGADGRIHGVKVRHGLGLGLDEKAMDAVRAWLFRPAMRNGKPISVSAVIEINFRLL